jgi:ABC-type xylose transport system substrate-binding protein
MRIGREVTNVKNDRETIHSYLCIPVIVDRENLNIVKG